MNDDIKKMLIDAGTSVETKEFTKEVNELSNFATQNTQVMYKEVYRLLIEKYKENPDEKYYYLILVGYTTYSTSSGVNGISLKNHVSNLAKAFNNNYKYDEIVFYSPSSYRIPSQVFKLKSLEAMLKADGLEVKNEYPYLTVSINATKLRSKIQELINNQNPNKTR